MIKKKLQNSIISVEEYGKIENLEKPLYIEYDRCTNYIVILGFETSHININYEKATLLCIICLKMRFRM